MSRYCRVIWVHHFEQPHLRRWNPFDNTQCCLTWLSHGRIPNQWSYIPPVGNVCPQLFNCIDKMKLSKPYAGVNRGPWFKHTKPRSWSRHLQWQTPPRLYLTTLYAVNFCHYGTFPAFLSFTRSIHSYQLVSQNHWPNHSPPWLQPVLSDSHHVHMQRPEF